MSDERKPTPKIYVMPEQFLALTRSAGLPIQRAPPPPVAAPPLGARGGVGELPSAPEPTSTPPSPASATVPASAVSVPSQISNLKSQIPSGPGLPTEDGKRKMFIVWGAIAGVILIGGGLAAFFALRSVAPLPAPQPPAPANTIPAPAPPTNVAPESEPEQELESEQEQAPEPAPKPEPAPPAADRDTDSDGLTDAEEILFSTDVALADTDRDGYSDATELANLYNPAGIAPQRLLDAGLVYEYEHPKQGWKILIPRAWSVAATDQEQRQLIISTGAAGEQIVVNIHENPDRLPIAAAATRFWPAAAEPAAELVQTATTKRGAEVARLSDDPLRALFLAGDRVVIVSHEVREQPPRYPHVSDMIVQSIASPLAP